MIFSELYGVYYATVAKIIEKAIEGPLNKQDIRSIIEEYAFEESILHIEDSLSGEKWQLINRKGITVITNKPTIPLTNLQKRWLKAISLDKRIKLFGEELSGLEEIVPLFSPDDVVIFDKYADGDPYEKEEYIKTFRLILDAVRNGYPLKIVTRGRTGRKRELVVIPEYLEYSEKDDKFRMIGYGQKHGEIINLGRILSCEKYEKNYDRKDIAYPYQRTSLEERMVELELIDNRNALERVLLHFAHFKKQAEKVDDIHYKISIYYDKSDETEVLIRILSFGPMVKVIGPVHFENLIKKRLLSQKSCGH